MRRDCRCRDAATLAHLQACQQPQQQQAREADRLLLLAQTRSLTETHAPRSGSRRQRRRQQLLLSLAACICSSLVLWCTCRLSLSRNGSSCTRLLPPSRFCDGCACVNQLLDRPGGSVCHSSLRQSSSQDRSRSLSTTRRSLHVCLQLHLVSLVSGCPAILVLRRSFPRVPFQRHPSPSTGAS